MPRVSLKIKRSIMMMTTVIIVLFGIIIALYLYTIVKEDFNDNLKSFSKNVHKTSDVFLKLLEKGVSTHADLMISSPTVVEALRNQDRKMLLKKILPIYQKMSKYNPYIKIMTFRLADGSAFLRLHKPELFGDTLSKEREIISDTNRLQKRHYGFEVGKLNMTYRIVSPVFYKNDYIGSIEIGIEPEFLTDKLNRLFQSKGALLVKKSMFFNKVDGLQKEQKSDFIFIRGDDLFKTGLTNNNKDFNADTIVSYEDKNYWLDKNTINLLNHKGEVKAKIVLGYEIDQHLEKIESMIKYIILYISLLIILLLVLHYFLLKMNRLNTALSLKSIELKILNNTLETRIKNVVHKSREKDKQMLAQSRLAQMGEMLSMIAHQWRQPLTAIGAASGLMELKAKLHALDNDMVEEKSKKISAMVQHLSVTIDDFRNFFKPNKTLKETNYDEVIGPVLGITEKLITDKGIEIVQMLNCHEKFMAYSSELKQVVLNLIKNAEDVLLERETVNPCIRIYTYQNDDQYILEVCDNAGGIPEEIMNNIFDPYFSTKDDKNGTGLGLYMSKIMIEDHCSGKLLAKNNKEGAVFTIALPPISEA